MRNTLLITVLLIFVFNVNTEASSRSKRNGKFKFAFFTDIHLNKGDNNCFQGLEKAINCAKSEGVDFIITGGDQVDVDGLGKDDQTAFELYDRYSKATSNIGLNYYAAIGNHDRFWGCDKNDPLYNEGLFEKFLNKSYYSFDHKGWHFVVLNTSNSVVDEKQKEWLVADLDGVGGETPIVVVAHVPFISLYYVALQGRYTSTDTFSNSKEILDMFKGKNLKLVLQGHQHLYEEIKILGIQFITAGAVSASWWGGDYHGTEEGFLQVECKGDEFSWEYVDYGWEVTK